MDPIWCCAVGICCPPASQEQFDAFVKVLMSHPMDEEKATKIAKALQKDLIAFSKKLKKAVEA
jgi:hypothetical protein